MLIGRFLIMNLFVGILSALQRRPSLRRRRQPGPSTCAGAHSAGFCLRVWRAPDLAPVRLKGRSLCLFGPDHLRQLCQYLHTALFSIHRHGGDHVLVGVPWLDSPRNDPNSPRPNIAQLDLVWTCLFILEMAIKVVAKDSSLEGAC